MASRDYFLGKRVAVIGVGIHGEMLSDLRYLVKSNALVSVYDLRSEAKLSSVLPSLRSLGLANLILGSVPDEDLVDADLIILSHEYPRDSSFLALAKKAGIQIEYPETFFLKLAPPINVIGIMGDGGKSTVVSMLLPMFELACQKDGIQSSLSANYESGEGILSNLKRIKSGDILTMLIEPKMMHEISALRWSPHIAVFTTIPHVAGRSPFEILTHQTYNNHVIGSDSIIDSVRASGFHSKAKLLRTKPTIIPEEWLENSNNPHDRENAALALQVARLFKVSDDVALDVFIKWRPLRGRLEFVKKIRNVDFYNDAASQAPVSTISGMQVLSKDKNLVLIVGGTDTGAECGELCVAIPKYAHTIITVPGSGTLKQRRLFSNIENVKMISAPSLEEAVRQSIDHAQKGDNVLFSPGFEAGGVDASRTERGDRFVRAVRAL